MLGEEPLTVIGELKKAVPLESDRQRRDDIRHISKPLSRLPFQLPISTETMTPGKVVTTAKPLPTLRQPIFFIGSDRYSQSWLKARRQQLIKLGAMGFLVQANDMADLKAMAALGHGLHIIPASAQQIAKEIGLTHYPILVSSDGWEQ